MGETQKTNNLKALTSMCHDRMGVWEHGTYICTCYGTTALPNLKGRAATSFVQCSSNTHLLAVHEAKWRIGLYHGIAEVLGPVKGPTEM